LSGPNTPQTSSSVRRWRLLAVAVMILAAYLFIEQRYVAERRELVLQQDDIAQALTRAELQDYGDIFEHDGALYAGVRLINWSDTLVDAVKADSRCGVTIYQGDVRIATTMVKPGTNERATGTHATPEVKHAVLDEGRTYRGSIQELDHTWIMVVTPFKDGHDQVIGMIATFTGVEQLGVQLAYFRLMLGGAMTALFLALVVMVIQAGRQQRENALAIRAMAEDRAKQHARFFESMTRELRTPLSALAVFVSSLFDSIQDERSREVVRRAQGETKDLLALVDDILDFARLEADSLEMRAEEIDLRRIADQSLETVKARATALGVRLESELPDDMPKASGDPARAQQAITNLLVAAIRATHEGRVRIRGRAEHDAVTIEVTDNGPGLTASQTMAVWDPFHLAAGPTGREGGSGLALSIARGLVERMGGSVEATSKHGKGTTLKLKLPRASVTA
jgi:signal transduction histidine kinase